jgi:hypothetical protein
LPAGSTPAADDCHQRFAPVDGAPQSAASIEVRASDAERDATVNCLGDAAPEGRLTLGELTDRIEAVANAVMRADLVLTSDLPATAAAGAGARWAPIALLADARSSSL